MPEPRDWIGIVNEAALELRSPLAAIMGFVELIQYSGPLTERQEYFSERALSSVRQMELLIARMVELGWIEADHALALSACDLDAVVARSLDLLRDQAESREITIQLEIDPHLGAIEADARHVEQVVVNLLINAIKYNRRGGTIWVNLRGYDDDVEITVRDNGYGIMADDLPHIWERYYCSTARPREVIPGMGLGLWIVKTIVEKHGGRVWVDSVVNVGTTFGFGLPRVPSSAVGLSEDTTGSREAATTPFDVPDSLPADYAASGEQIDAVDDNLQEPPSFNDDHDDDDDALSVKAR